MTAPSHPNILIFMVDQMQADVTREEHPCHLPRIKALAREGVRFARAFTYSPHCCPSRATFMSGCTPSRHGIGNNVNTVTAHRYELNPGIRLFSEDLAAAGYDMAFAGKWHVALADRPAHRGWRELSSRPDATILPDKDRFDRVPDHDPGAWATLDRPGWGSIPLAPPPIEGPDALTGHSWYRDAIVPALTELPRLAAGAAPWCLFVSTDMDPQNPVPKPFVDRYDPGQVTPPRSYADDLKDKPNIYRRLRSQYWDQLTPPEVRAAMINYWANCSREDWHFGLLLDALDASGQADNTLVLFVADHGEYNFAHGLQFMGIPCFREAYHVPAIVRWPAGIRRPGRAVDRFVTLADFAPTFTDLAGVTGKTAVSGNSLVPFLQDRIPADWPDAVFTQTNGNEVYFTQRSVTTDRYKYVYNAFDFDELYDLEQDPDEMVNLIHPSRWADPADGTKRFANPWPHLPPELDAVRREMMQRIWRFAHRENDIIFNPWPPVAMAAYGPGISAVSRHGCTNKQDDFAQVKDKSGQRSEDRGQRSVF